MTALEKARAARWAAKYLENCFSQSGCYAYAVSALSRVARAQSALARKQAQRQVRRDGVPLGFAADTPRGMCRESMEREPKVAPKYVHSDCLAVIRKPAKRRKGRG